MKNYIIFEKETGKITKQVSCSENMIELQLNEIEDYIEGKYDDKEFFVNIKTNKVELIPNNMRSEIVEITPIKTVITKEERLIRERQRYIIRQQAIQELQKEGKLPLDYEIIKE